MHTSTSSLLTRFLASGAAASIALFAALPAVAEPGHHHPARRTTAPVRVERVAPVHYRAVRVERGAPARVRYAAPAPFVRRVTPERHFPAVRHAAPFVQYVRSAPARRRRILTRAIAVSPLIHAVTVARARTIPVVYHPRYVAGRVDSVRRDAVVIDPVTGPPVIVRNVVVESAAPAFPVGSVVTLPVTYANGAYDYAPQYGYASEYGYAPQYGYAYAPPMYCNGNSSSGLYAALLPAIVGVLTGNGGSSFNTSDLAQIAISAAGGGAGGNCMTAPASYGYGAPARYVAAPPVTYADATPYDACMSSDNDRDEACAEPASSYAYPGNSMYGAYMPQQVQGIVVARSGDTLMLIGANGTPTFVYAAPALQSGFAVNGPVQPGQIVDAYGYYSGNTFVATALE